MPTTPTPLLFCDTETTGLDPERHEIWEVAAIRRDPDGTQTDAHWFLPVDLGRADQIALNIGGFHDRYESPLTSHITFAREFMQLANGCHLVGAVPSFDEQRLRRLLRAHGACESWHYHLICVENLAVGYLSAKGLREGDFDLMDLAAPPWNSKDLSRALGVDPDHFDAHTAMGDTLWAMAMYDEIMS